MSRYSSVWSGECAGRAEKLSDARASAVDECAAIIRAALSAMPPGPLKSRQDALSRRWGISVRRIRGYWNAEIRAVSAEEADFLRARRVEILNDRQRQLDAEMQALKAALAHLEQST